MLTLSLAPILRQSLPIEVFWPLAEVEGKLEPHISWESDEVIKVIRREHTSHMSVGTDVDGPYLVRTIDQISWRQNLRFFQKFINVQNNNSPAIVLQLKRNLSNEAVGCVEVLEKVRNRDTDTMRSLSHTKV